MTKLTILSPSERKRFDSPLLRIGLQQPSCTAITFEAFIMLTLARQNKALKAALSSLEGVNWVPRNDFCFFALCKFSPSIFDFTTRILFEDFMPKINDGPAVQHHVEGDRDSVLGEEAVFML